MGVELKVNEEEIVYNLLKVENGHRRYGMKLKRHIINQDKEIQRLNNIIKEVREYLTDEGVCILNKGKKENERLVWTWENYYDLLEILDKEK